MRGVFPSVSVRRWSVIVLVITTAVIAVVLTLKWPFTRERALRALGHAAESRAEAAKFHLTFFPEPGFVASDVSFRREAGAPLVTARRLTVVGSWAALFTLRHRVSRMILEGLVVHIPRPLPPPVRFEGHDHDTTISELIADSSVLEIERTEGPPLRFELSKVRLREAGKQRTIQYETTMRIPEPAGKLSATGTFGPWRSGNAGETPLSGTFDLQEADLSQFKDLSGKISAAGSFKGKLSDIGIHGTTDTHEFAVNGSEHRVRLQTAFDASVNAMHGDVSLTRVDARFRKTRIIAAGRIAGEPGTEGKVARIDFDAREARVEDLLWLCVKSGSPALRGPITLQAHVTLPPGKDRFLHKLLLSGDFRINDARFAKVQTRTSVNGLSARARGEPEEADANHTAPEVLSDLRAHIEARNGVASLSGISFVVPGATARGQGTYNLLSKKVDLDGTVAMEAKVSETAKGFKSILLKPIDWFVKKNRSGGSTVPVHVGGYWPHATFAVSLTRRRH